MEEFEINTNPMSIRVSLGKSEHWQMTIPVEVRKRFNLTPENAHTKKFIFAIKSDGTVELKCVDAKT